MKKWIHAIYRENRGFLKSARHIGRGLKKMILGGIFQYFLKIGVLFHMPRMNVLWHGFTKWRPRAFPLLLMHRSKVLLFLFEFFAQFWQHTDMPYQARRCRGTSYPSKFIFENNYGTSAPNVSQKSHEPRNTLLIDSTIYIQRLHLFDHQIWEFKSLLVP